MGDRKYSRGRSRSRSPFRKRSFDGPRRGGGTGGPRGGGFRGLGGSGGGGRGGGFDSRTSFKEGCLVYITQLPYDVRWMDLKNLIMEKAGEVNFIELLQSPQGKPKGAAVVEFKDRDGAEMCLRNMDKLEVGTRTIDVSPIRDPGRFFESLRMRAGIDFLGQGNRPMSQQGGPSPMGPGGPSSNFETYGIPPQILNEARIEGPLIDRIFIGGLPVNHQAAKVRDLMSIAGRVLDVETMLDREGHCHGFAIVRYSHPVEATQAILLLHRQRYCNRQLEVKFDRKEPPRARMPNEFPSGLDAIGRGFGPNGEADPNIIERMVRSGALPATALGPGSNASTGSFPSGTGIGNGIGAVTGNAGVMPAGNQGMVSNNFGSGGMGGTGVPLSGTMNMGGIIGTGTGSSMAGGNTGGMMGPSAIMGGSGGGGGAGMVGMGGMTGQPQDMGSGRMDNMGGSSNMSQYGMDRGMKMEGGMSSSMGGAPFDMGSSSASGYTGGAGGGYMNEIGSGGPPADIMRSIKNEGGYGTSSTSMVMAGGGLGGASSGNQPSYGSAYGSSSGYGGGGGGRDNVGGSGGRDRGREGYSVLVRNLPMDMTWQDLKDMARKAGDVEHVDVKDGVGKIRFRSETDASRAIRLLDNFVFEGRRLVAGPY